MIKNLDHVLSGCAYLYIFRGFMNDVGTPNRRQVISEALDFMRKDFNSRKEYKKLAESFDISCLFNGFTEDSFGKSTPDRGFDHVFVDSGGLQVLTLGKKVTPEIKRGIYRTQAPHDYAFCFDEMPVVLPEMASEDARTLRLRQEMRTYVSDLVPEKGKATAQNVLEQIKVFREEKAKARVLYIFQIQKEKDARAWAKEMLETIPEEDFEYIGGYAIAPLNTGKGPRDFVEVLDGFRRAYKDFPEYAKKKRLHLLGVGSPRRLSSVLAIVNSPIFPKEITHLSIDSTSLTSSLALGTMVNPETGTGYVTQAHAVEKTFDYFAPLLEKYYTKQDIHDARLHVCNNVRAVARIRDCKGKNERVEDICNIMISLCPIHELVTFFDLCYNFVKRGYDSKALDDLSKVTTEEEFDDWKNAFWQFMESNPVRRAETLKRMTEYENTLF